MIEDVYECIREAQRGDAAAMEKLVRDNDALVHYVVKRLKTQGREYEDLYQLGRLGLVRAVRNFDESYGVKFSTYAVPMIIGEVRRYLRDNNSIRVSRSLRDLAYKALQIRDKLSSENEKEPTIEQITDALNKAHPEEHHEKEEIASALDAIVAPVSLFEPIYNDSGSGDSVYLMDQLSDREADEKWLESLALKEALGHLSERENKIIRMRFFGGSTQMEIAEEIGISQAQVSRLEKNALAKIKKFF